MTSTSLSPANRDDVFLTEKQLAERWSCSIRTLQNKRVIGTSIQFVKIGSMVRYRLSDIERFENDRTFSSTSEIEDSLVFANRKGSSR
jgi:hypothetical protein